MYVCIIVMMFVPGDPARRRRGVTGQPEFLFMFVMFFGVSLLFEVFSFLCYFLLMIIEWP